MKITIDTTAKTIKVEESISFCELQKELKKLIGDAIKDYTLLPIETKINWIQNPVPVWPYYNPPPLWISPITSPCVPPYTITCGTGTLVAAIT